MSIPRQCYAVLERDDQNHARAAAVWGRLVDDGSALITTSYVVVECCALAQHRLGLEAVRAIHLDVLRMIDVVWVRQKS